MAFENSGNHSLLVSNSRSSSDDDVIILDVDDSDDLFPDVIVTKKPKTIGTHNKGAGGTSSSTTSEPTAFDPQNKVAKSITSAIEPKVVDVSKGGKHTSSSTKTPHISRSPPAVKAPKNAASKLIIGSSKDTQKKHTPGQGRVQGSLHKQPPGKNISASSPRSSNKKVAKPMVSTSSTPNTGLDISSKKVAKSGGSTSKHNISDSKKVAKLTGSAPSHALDGKKVTKPMGSTPSRVLDSKKVTKPMGYGLSHVLDSMKVTKPMGSIPSHALESKKVTKPIGPVPDGTKVTKPSGSVPSHAVDGKKVMKPKGAIPSHVKKVTKPMGSHVLDGKKASKPMGSLLDHALDSKKVMKPTGVVPNHILDSGKVTKPTGSAVPKASDGKYSQVTKTVLKDTGTSHSTIKNCVSTSESKEMHQRDHGHVKSFIPGTLSKKSEHKKKTTTISAKTTMSKSPSGDGVQSSANKKTDVTTSASSTTLTLSPKSTKLTPKSPAMATVLPNKQKSNPKSHCTQEKSISVPCQPLSPPSPSPKIITLQHFPQTSSASTTTDPAVENTFNFNDDDIFEVLDSVESEGFYSAYNQSDSDSNGDLRPSAVDPRVVKSPTCRLPSESRMSDFTKSFIKSKSRKRQVARKSTALNGARLYKHPLRGRGRVCMKARFCTLKLERLPKETLQKAKDSGLKHSKLCQSKIPPKKKKLSDPLTSASQSKRPRLSSNPSPASKSPAILSSVISNEKEEPEAKASKEKQKVPESVKRNPQLSTEQKSLEKNQQSTEPKNPSTTVLSARMPKSPPILPKSHGSLPLILRKPTTVSHTHAPMAAVMSHANSSVIPLLCCPTQSSLHDNSPSEKSDPPSTDKSLTPDHQAKTVPQTTPQKSDYSGTAIASGKSSLPPVEPGISTADKPSEHDHSSSEQSVQNDEVKQTPAVRPENDTLPAPADKGLPSALATGVSAVSVAESSPTVESVPGPALEICEDAILSQTDDVFTPVSTAENCTEKLSMRDEAYDMRLMETIAKLTPTPAAQNHSRNHSTACEGDENSSAGVPAQDELGLVVKFPLSKLSRVPCSSPSAVLTSPIGLFKDVSIQAERGMIIDKEVLDNYLSVKLHEAMLSMKEQLQFMEAQVSSIAKQKESLERTLQAKTQYIRDMTTTGFRPVMVDKETLTDPCPVSTKSSQKQPKNRKTKKVKEVGTQTRPKTATVSSQTDGFARHVPARLRQRSQSVCLYSHPESELQLYIEEGRKKAEPLREGNSDNSEDKRERWLTSAIVDGDCSRSVAVSQKARFLKAVLHSSKFENATTEMEVVADPDTANVDGTQGILFTHKCIPETLHAPILTIAKLYHKLKLLPKEPVQERHLLTLLDSLQHLFLHLPVEVRSSPLPQSTRDISTRDMPQDLVASPEKPCSSIAIPSPSTPSSGEQSSITPPSTPGAASWAMGAKIQALSDALQDLHDKGRAILPKYFKAELVQLQIKTRETLGFLTKGLRHETFAHDKSGCIVNSDIQPRPWRDRDLKINPYFHRLFLDIGLRGVIKELNRLGKHNIKGRLLGKESSEEDSDLEMLFSASPPAPKRQAKAPTSATSPTKKGKALKRTSQQRKTSLSKQRIHQNASQVHEDKNSTAKPQASQSSSGDTSKVPESSTALRTESPPVSPSMQAATEMCDGSTPISGILATGSSPSTSVLFPKKHSGNSTGQTVDMASASDAVGGSSSPSRTTEQALVTALPSSTATMLSTATASSNVTVSSSTAIGPTIHASTIANASASSTATVPGSVSPCSSGDSSKAQSVAGKTMHQLEKRSGQATRASVSASSSLTEPSSNPHLIENCGMENVFVHPIIQRCLKQALKEFTVLLQSADITPSVRETYNQVVVNVGILLNSSSTSDLQMASLLISQMTQKLQGRPWPIGGNSVLVRPFTTTLSQIRPVSWHLPPRQPLMISCSSPSVMGHSPACNYMFYPTNMMARGVGGNAARVPYSIPSLSAPGSATISCSPVTQAQLSAPISSTPPATSLSVNVEQSTVSAQGTDTPLVTPGSTVSATSQGVTLTSMPTSTVSAASPVVTPGSTVSATSPVVTPGSSVSASSPVVTPGSSVSAASPVVTPGSAVSAASPVVTPGSTVSASSPVVTPGSTVSATSPVVTPGSTVSAPSPVVTPISTVSATLPVIVASTTAAVQEASRSPAHPTSCSMSTAPNCSSVGKALITQNEAGSSSIISSTVTVRDAMEILLQGKDMNQNVATPATSIPSPVQTCITSPASTEISSVKAMSKPTVSESAITVIKEQSSSVVPSANAAPSTTSMQSLTSVSNATMTSKEDKSQKPETASKRIAESIALSIDSSPAPSITQTSQKAPSISSSEKVPNSVSVIPSSSQGLSCPKTSFTTPSFTRVQTQSLASKNVVTSTSSDDISTVGHNVLAGQITKEAAVSAQVKKTSHDQLPQTLVSTSGTTLSSSMITSAKVTQSGGPQSARNQMSPSDISTSGSGQSSIVKAAEFAGVTHALKSTENKPAQPEVCKPASLEKTLRTSSSAPSTPRSVAEMGSSVLESVVSTSRSASSTPASGGAHIYNSTVGMPSLAVSALRSAVTALCSAVNTPGSAVCAPSPKVNPLLSGVSARTSAIGSMTNKSTSGIHAPGSSVSSAASTLVSGARQPEPIAGSGVRAPQSAVDPPRSAVNLLRPALGSADLPRSNVSTAKSTINPPGSAISVPGSSVSISVLSTSLPPVEPGSVVGTLRPVVSQPGRGISSPASVSVPVTSAAPRSAAQTPPMSNPMFTSLRPPIPRPESSRPSLAIPPSIVHAPPLSSMRHILQQESPPEVTVQVTKSGTGLVIKWTFAPEFLSWQSRVECYQLYAFVSNSSAEIPNVSMWGKVGEIKPLPLPMAVTLTNFSRGQHYAFSVRAQYIGGAISNYSSPCIVFL